MARSPAAEPAEATAAAKASRQQRARRVAAVVVGTLVIALLVYYAGFGQVLFRLRALGWAAPLIFVPYLVINVLDTYGWRCTLPRALVARVPFSALYLARMAGEAVNSVTPTAAVGGEPVKAHLLRVWGVPGSDGVASVVIAKTALTVSQIAFILFGLAALFDRLERRALGAFWLAVLIAVGIGFTILVVRLQRRGPVSTVWRWLQRIAPRSPLVARLEARAEAIDSRLADFYGEERTAFHTATLFHLGGWLLGVVEVWMMMALIGSPISLRDAFVIEALAQPIRAAALFIPGGLGAQEVGGVALCTFLGVPEAAAVTLWLLKRARELVFDAIGLAYLTRHGVRH
jgi:putative membrane protein